MSRVVYSDRTPGNATAIYSRIQECARLEEGQGCGAPNCADRPEKRKCGVSITASSGRSGLRIWNLARVGLIKGPLSSVARTYAVNIALVFHS